MQLRSFDFDMEKSDLIFASVKDLRPHVRYGGLRNSLLMSPKARQAFAV